MSDWDWHFLLAAVISFLVGVVLFEVPRLRRQVRLLTGLAERAADDNAQLLRILHAGHTLCPRCKKEIDPVVCHCGTELERHAHANHVFVPLGCVCMTHRPSDLHPN
jgi:predicted amidophosphoribosyltransferase